MLFTCLKMRNVLYCLKIYCEHTVTEWIKQNCYLHKIYELQLLLQQADVL